MSATIRTTGTQTIIWPDGSTTTVPIDSTQTLPISAPPPAEALTVTVQTAGTQTITRSDGVSTSAPFESTVTVETGPPDPGEPPTDAHPEHPIVIPPDPLPEVAGLAVVITMSGQHHTFAQADGTDRGDYVDPDGAFVQRCIAVTCATLPGFLVQFRPDADGKRDEVVFEYGLIWSAPEPRVLPDYTATISRDGQTLATQNVRQHKVYLRWRWQSAPRPVRRTAAELIEAGLLPHYDATVTNGTLPVSQVTYDGPMSLAGLTGYMPTTGERGELGLITEWQADYLITGNSLESMRAQLEASGSFPMNFRDERTGAPIHIYDHPMASCYWSGAGANPWIKNAVETDPAQADVAHQPSLGYVLYLLTGDPYALEHEQNEFCFDWTSQPAGWGPTYYNSGQVRAHAWALRTAARVARVTPEVVPSWLHQRSYFKKNLDGNRAWCLERANSPNEPHRTFRFISEAVNTMGELSCFMEDMDTAVIAHTVEMGHTDWRPVLEWKIKSNIARTAHAEGWNRSQPAVYQHIVRDGADGAWATSWAESWDLNIAAGTAVHANPEHLVPGDWTYPGYTHAGLAIAARLGIAVAEPGRDYLRAEFQARGPGAIAAKWCIA
jgi:hypothetical protein